jgi:ammonia channel protein AmtB
MVVVRVFFLEYETFLTKILLISGGVMGAFMTGLFSDVTWNPNGADGAFYGRPVQLWYQIAGILTAIGIY